MNSLESLYIKVGLLIFAFFSSIFSEDTLHLFQTVQLAKNNNLFLAAMRTSERVSIAHENIAKSNFQPTMNAVASYTNLGPTEEIDFPLAVGARSDPVTGQPSLIMQSFPFQLFPENNYDIHANIDYLLFDFGKRTKNVELTKLATKAYSDRYLFAADNIVYQAIVLFETLMMGERIIIAKNEDISNLRKHLDFVKRKIATGSATDFDILRTQSQISDAINDSISLQNEQNKWVVDLKQILAIESSPPISVQGDFDSVNISLSIDSMIKIALENRKEIHLLKIELKTFENQRLIYKLDNLPSISLRVQGGIKNGYVTDVDELKWNWAAGCQLTVPVYNGKRKTYRLNEIDARIDSLKIVIRDTKNRVKNDVLKTFSDMESGYQNIKAAYNNYSMSNESYKIAKIQYEAGAFTNLDLLDAESKLTRSKFTLVQSEYKHLLGCLSLLHAAGKDLSDTTALLSIGMH